MRIFLACGKSITVPVFRRKLIEKLLSLGHEVHVSVFDNEHEEEIRAMGVGFSCLNDANRSLNPFKILSLKSKYAKEIRKINPDIVLTFMLKPNIYGTLGAKKAGVKSIYSMVEGAGDVYTYNSLKWKLIRTYVSSMYRKAFKHSKKVFFLNLDDKDEFVERKIVDAEKCEIIHGIGVDIERFAYKPVQNQKSFLMVARLLKTKGVLEYCEAAKIVKEKYPEATFNYLGAEGTVTLEDIKAYTDAGIVNYLGTTKDVVPYFEDTAVNVLPSYREGLGLVNAEAGAIGRPSITCDTNGTRDTVIDGYNGFLVPIKNAQALAGKMIYFLENPEMIEEMGKNARKFAEENFDQRKINEYICNIVLN